MAWRGTHAGVRGFFPQQFGYSHRHFAGERCSWDRFGVKVLDVGSRAALPLTQLPGWQESMARWLKRGLDSAEITRADARVRETVEDIPMPPVFAGERLYPFN
jgi:hypothetical protein